MAGGAASAYADSSPQMKGAEASKPTIGQMLANGSMSEPQLEQLVQFTGLTPAEAKGYTLDEVSVMRWKD